MPYKISWNIFFIIKIVFLDKKKALSVASTRAQESTQSSSWLSNVKEFCRAPPNWYTGVKMWNKFSTEVTKTHNRAQLQVIVLGSLGLSC
jgi:hypothetical protein